MIDLAIVIIYMIVVLGIGLLSGLKVRDLKDYSVSKNSFTTFVMVAAIFATLVGGGSTMGISEKVFSSGLVFLVACLGFVVRDILTAIFIVPKFKTMFDNMGAELPALTSFMLNLSNFVTSITFAIGAPLIITVSIYLFGKYYSTKRGKLFVDSNILKIPLFGDLLLRSEMAGMCDTLSTLVNSGIPIVDSMNRCISASSNELIRQTIQRSILLVTQGQELNYSMGRSNVFPKLVISMIKIGEETGQLSFMLDKLAVFYKREVEATVSALTKAMEPAVIFVVAGIVGTIVIALYLPMFSLIGNMGN